MESSAPRSLEAARRKLRAIAAVLADAGATPNERINAAAVKARLERGLKAAGEPAGDWTDSVFRLGRLARNLEKSSAPRSPKGDWTDHALRLGKALRRSYRRWLAG